MKISITWLFPISFWAWNFTIFCLGLYNEQNITQWLEDMTFYSLAAIVRKILSWFHLSKIKVISSQDIARLLESVKKYSLAARVFYTKVSQHPACIDDAILHENHLVFLECHVHVVQIKYLEQSNCQIVSLFTVKYLHIYVYTLLIFRNIKFHQPCWRYFKLLVNLQIKHTYN